MKRIVDISAGIVLSFVLALTVGAAIPTGFWFEVRGVEVLDSDPGVAPRMIVDRTIQQPFIGEWNVTVLKVVDEGFEPFCRASGRVDYDPANRLPSPLDLDWWTWPTQCQLPEGRYVVRTVWTLNVFGVLTKTVRNVSNLFHIYKGAGQDGNAEESHNNESEYRYDSNELRAGQGIDLADSSLDQVL